MELKDNELEGFLGAIYGCILDKGDDPDEIPRNLGDYHLARTRTMKEPGLLSRAFRQRGGLFHTLVHCAIGFVASHVPVPAPSANGEAIVWSATSITR
jgi:hypothetical protein